MRSHDLVFWTRWVIANSLAEAIGLGTVFLVGFSLLKNMDALSSSPVIAIALLLSTILLGAFEGLVVGAVQRMVLTDRLPRLTLRAWIIPTILGALIAWVLGMLPSTMMSSAPSGDTGSAADIPDWIMYFAAMPMGAVLGAVLASVQFVTLRHHVAHAWIWLLANALAWLFGMPVIFMGMSFIPSGASPLQSALVMYLTVAVAGAVVGAVHGFILVRFLLSGHQIQTETGWTG